MKIISFLLSLTFLILSFNSELVAQDIPNSENFEHNDSHLFCGANEAKALRGPNNTPIAKSLPSPLSPDMYILCGGGKFRIIFMDIVNNTNFGFDTPTSLAQVRKDCVCSVIDYLVSVIEIPANIGTTDPTIDIIFNVSTNNASMNPLASATAVYPPEFYNPSGPYPLPGYYGGYLYNYITTGIKPDVNSEEAQVTVDFQNLYSYCQSTVPDCQLDFYSIILHELTHALGFISFGKEVSGVLTSKISTSVFSKLDEHFLYYNDAGVFRKMFDVTAFSGTNGVNPLLPLNAATDNNVWLDSVLINKQNQPINSVAPYSAGTSLSHLDSRYNLTSTGVGRTNVSPGYSPNYLMNGSILYQQKKREITLEEVEILQTIGYTINPTFPQLANISNKTPYHQGNLITPIWFNAGAYFNTTPASGLNDLTIATSNGTPVTLNLTTGIMTNGTTSQPLNFIDPDGDPITVYEPNPGWKGIYNLRGCGSGNNADQITINATRDIITFTPRDNFIGRAQFAFHLYDGVERGDYVVITVDVAKGPTFINIPANELVINGGFEEGSQYRENNGVDEFNIVADEINTSMMYALKQMSDGVQYWSFASYDYHIINSVKNCLFFNSTDFCYGNCNTNIPESALVGNRYVSYVITSSATREYFNMQLSEPVAKCSTYVLKADIKISTILQQPNFTPTSMINFKFHDQGFNTNVQYGPILQSVDYPISSAMVDTWTPISITFTYNSDTPTPIFQVDGTDFYGRIAIDNVSVQLVNTPPSITISPSTSIICTGESVNLIASGSNAYIWTPATGLNTNTGESVIATPTTTTTYTVTDPSGCAPSANVTITVTPQVTINNPNNTIVCVNSPIPTSNFTSNTSGVTYNWTNSNTSIGLASSGTGNTPSFTALNNTGVPQVATITVTPIVNGCAGTSITYTITVNPVPTINSVSNSSICANTIVSGTNFSSSPSGATFNWTNSNTSIGLASIGTGNIPSFTALNTTSVTQIATLTVTPTLNGCMGTPITYTITVNPLPVVTISPAASSIIAGTSVGLTASGAISYSWTPPTNLSCTTCANPTASPVTTTTYTVIGTSNNCVDTASVIITVIPTPCGTCPNVLAQNGILSSNPSPNQVYCVNNDITVNGNITISRSELKILPNVTITVSAGSTLNIVGSHLYACSDMWKGIVVQPTAKINITAYIVNGVTLKTTLIEDAIVGVDILSNNGLTTNVLTINTATFNRNRIGVRVQNYKLSLTVYPFTIVNSVFTCRNIPFTSNSISWPMTTSIKSATNPTSTPLETPYINNTTYSQMGTNAFLRAPYAGIKSQAGIYLFGIGDVINLTSSSPTYYEMVIGTIGAQKYNVFDNLAIGIDGLNSNFKVVNSIFQNTITSGNLGATGGIGIQAISQEKANNRLQVVGATPAGNFANKFFNCSRAIRSQEYFDNIIKYNDFRSMQIFSTLPNINKPGKFGIYITTNKFRKIDIYQNTMSNIENGIVFSANNTGTSAGAGQYSGQVDITYNTIRKNYPGFPIAGQYVSNAIMISNVVFSSNFVLVPGTNVNINYNTIVGAFRGISTTNWQNKNVNTSYNTVSLVLDGGFGNPLQYGISHTNNIPLNQNNTDHNSITGYNITNLKLYGIYISLSNRQYVSCNTTSTTYHGIAFAGNCSSTQTRFNSMSNHNYGFVLDNNGVIGLQGTATAPCDNQYLGTWPFGTYKTATLNGSSAQNSKMYVHAIGYTNPNGFGFTNGIFGITDYFYSTTLTNNTLLYVSGNANNIDCSEIFGINPTNPNEKQDLEKIVQNQMNEVQNPFETQKINKHQVYRLLKANPDAMLESSVLQNFYTNSQPTINEKLVSIETDFSQGDVSIVATKVADLLPLDNIESNYKLFYEIYNKSFGDTITDTLNPTDSLNLMLLASACPFIDGAIVYQARALYNTIYNTAILFEDNCYGTGGEKSLMITNQNSEGITNTNGFDVFIYPNPTTGNVSLIPIGIKEGELGIVIRDVMGKITHQSTISVTDSSSDFNMEGESGTYFVTFINLVNSEKTIKKLVIQK